jgi:hypothetical protein
MEKKQLLRLAVKVFFKQEMDEILDLVTNDQIKILMHVSEKKLFLAQDEVLDSVYKGDCDFVLFDHYKHCRNFDNAVTQYEEER